MYSKVGVSVCVSKQLYVVPPLIKGNLWWVKRDEEEESEQHQKMNVKAKQIKKKSWKKDGSLK